MAETFPPAATRNWLDVTALVVSPKVKELATVKVLDPLALPPLIVPPERTIAGALMVPEPPSVAVLLTVTVPPDVSEPFTSNVPPPMDVFVL